MIPYTALFVHTVIYSADHPQSDERGRGGVVKHSVALERLAPLLKQMIAYIFAKDVCKHLRFTSCVKTHKDIILYYTMNTFVRKVYYLYE